MSGARTPRPPLVPSTVLRTRRRQWGAREGGGRRPGDAESPRGRNRRDPASRPEVSARGVREERWGAPPGAARPGRPGQAGDAASVAAAGGREGPRRGAGSPSRVTAGPGRTGCPRLGTARPGHRPRGTPGPTWRLRGQRSRSLSANGPSERVCAAGGGSAGPATGTCVDAGSPRGGAARVLRAPRSRGLRQEPCEKVAGS